MSEYKGQSLSINVDRILLKELNLLMCYHITGAE